MTNSDVIDLTELSDAARTTGKMVAYSEITDAVAELANANRAANFGGSYLEALQDVIIILRGLVARTNEAAP